MRLKGRPVPQLLRQHLLQHLHLQQLRSMEATEATEASQAVEEGAGSQEEAEAEGTRGYLGNQTCLTCYLT